MIRLIERQFEVAVATDVAWKFVGRLAEWPKWARHIRRIDVTPPGELCATSAGAIVLRNGIRSTFRMTEFSPPRSWKWSGPLLWLTVHYDHRFEAINPSTTRLTWTVAAEGFGVALFGRLFAAIYSRNLDRAIPEFVKQLAP